MVDDGRVVPLFGDQVALEALMHQAANLKQGGGGGTSDGMEARVARLEKNVDTLMKDVSDMRTDVATLKENVRHLPTKPWMFSTLVAMLGALTVIVGLIVRFIPHA